MGRPVPEAAVDLPIRWIVGLVTLGCAASIATIHAGIKFYERFVGPTSYSEAVAPKATETTPVPTSPYPLRNQL